MKFRVPKVVSAKDAKYKLGEILDKARFGHELILVSKRKNPWAVILGVEDYQDLLDQLETMAEQLDPDFQQSLRQSMEEYRMGKVGTVEDIQKILRQKPAKGKKRASI